ncbi:MAG TPA: alpha/beta hydrolase [Anaerolineales bacterium]|nr:alpha/beta hydrolase [Anaerolineales bacterium]
MDADLPIDQQPRHVSVVLPQLTLHTVQAGPPDGPLVLLLHGFPEFWFGWRRQIEALAAAGYRVVAPDQRGYNLSDKPRGVAAYQVDRLAEDVIGLIDALGRERAVVVGHDWGAAVAWHTAICYPERLEKLVILNVPHLGVMMETLRRGGEQVLKSWYVFFFQLPGLPEWLLSQNNFQPMRRMLQASANPGTFAAWELDRYAEAWRQPGALTAMLNWYRAIFRAGVRTFLEGERRWNRRVPVPTLMLWGVKDIALSREMAPPSIEMCDQGKLVFFEDATHWVQHDRPEQVNRLLLDFLGDREVIAP